MKKKSLKKSGRKKISGVNVVGYLFCGLIALVCLIPFYHGAGSIIYFGRSDFPIWIQSVAERVFLGSI